MLVRFTKQAPAATADLLTCIRSDGTTTAHPLPRQAVLPHDAVHFAVEQTLQLAEGLFGPVATGATLAAATAQLHEPATKSPSRTAALQVESLVEVFQAEQWSGASPPDAFREKLRSACARRHVPAPAISPAEMEAVRTALRTFGAAWRPLAPGASLERTFSV
jgi:hypothetical protein